VDLSADGGDLRIEITGVPIAAGQPDVAGLRARVSAIGGRMSVDPSGAVRVWLPVPSPSEVRQ
jgi:hypothetical protein